MTSAEPLPEFLDPIQVRLEAGQLRLHGSIPRGPEESELAHKVSVLLNDLLTDIPSSVDCLVVTPASEEPPLGYVMEVQAQFLRMTTEFGEEYEYSFATQQMTVDGLAADDAATREFSKMVTQVTADIRHDNVNIAGKRKGA